MPLLTEAADTALATHPRKGRSPGIGCIGALAVVAVALWSWSSYANWLPPPPPPLPSQLPSPNGYDAVTALLPRLVHSADQPVLSRPERAAPSALVTAVKRQQATLDALRASLKLPFQCPPPSGDGSELLPFQDLRLMRNALEVEALVAVREGRHYRAAMSSLDLIALGVNLQQGGTVFHFYFADSYAAAAGATVEYVMPQLSAGEAKSAGRRLEQLIAQIPPPASTVRLNNHLCLIAVRNSITVGPAPDAPAFLTASELTLAQRAYWSAYRAFYPKRASYLHLTEDLAAQAAELEKPFPLRRLPPLRADMTFGFFTDFSLDNEGFSQSHAHYLSQLQLLRLMLALQEFQQRTGRPPDQLQQLAPRYLPRVEPDPLTGKPFHYQRKGTGYLLYGVGRDLVDHQGRPRDPKNGGGHDDVAGHVYRPTPGLLGDMPPVRPAP